MLGQPPADPGFVVPGLVIGVITDNGDKAGRVKVKYVGVGGEITSPWARVVTLGGGKQRGVLFQPEVDDEVLVGFENGVEEGKVGYRRITSRKNHVIELADGEGAEKQHVLIQLGTAQHKLRLGADRFDIEVANGKPLTIKAGSAMFDINASGNISIEGKNVTIKADNTLSLQGGPKVAVESNGQLQVQGATVDVKSNGTANVQASGPLALKGATVAIN
jgi:phage baseplate assembly protein gpV